MIITDKNYYIANTKSFFMPWQNTDISYDALLGVSFTLAAGVSGDIYLTTYIKTANKLTIGFDLHISENGSKQHIIPIVREEVPIKNGLSVIPLSSKAPQLVNSFITVIDTKTIETYDEIPIQISPKFISIQSDKGEKYITICTDKEEYIDINLDNCTLNIESLDISLDYNNNLSVTYDKIYDAPQILDTSVGIRSINNNIAINGVVDINVSSLMSDHFTLSNTESTSCVNVDIQDVTLCDPANKYYTYFDPRNKKIFTPIDVCFTVPDIRFEPGRIDQLKFTHNKLKWDEIEIERANE